MGTNPTLSATPSLRDKKVFHDGAPVVKVFGTTGAAPCYAVRDVLYRKGVRVGACHPAAELP